MLLVLTSKMPTQLNLSKRLGGCWEITACATADGASIGTTYGCKPVPKPGGIYMDCDLNACCVVP